MRDSTVQRRPRALLVLAVALPLLSACSASVESLEDAVADEPGVIEVRAEDGGGEDDIPFAVAPKSVTVSMDGDATSAQVLTVFDAYTDEIDDGDVGLVEVTLAGPKNATLASGEGMQVTEGMVEDLIDAQRDDDVVKYRRQAYPVLPSVELELTPTDFAGVVELADRYGDGAGIELVEVVAGEFFLSRDEANDVIQVTTDREWLVRRIESRFRLRGAVVSGRGALELTVAPADQEAVRRAVARDPVAETVMKVVVRSARRTLS